MTIQSRTVEAVSVMLIEGPKWGDAELLGRWLISAAQANALLQQAKDDDPDFRKAINSLEVVRQRLDFGNLGAVFVAQFVDSQAFVVESDAEDLIEFSLMAHMGFFARQTAVTRWCCRER
jgi:hypothetical protein